MATVIEDVQEFRHGYQNAVQPHPGSRLDRILRPSQSGLYHSIRCAEFPLRAGPPVMLGDVLGARPSLSGPTLTWYELVDHAGGHGRHRLITRGVSPIRHPMYLALALYAVGSGARHSDQDRSIGT